VSIVGIAGDVGYVAVSVAVALETIGVPVPAETTLVAAAVLASQGQLAASRAPSCGRWIRRWTPRPPTDPPVGRWGGPRRAARLGT
jgi:hypothetical protein